MNKTEYIIGQIAKSYKKKYENYAITRIWHLLNSLDIKFVTQQHVTRPSGRALTDMYFPQIQLHIEVDEGQHFNSDGSQVDHDVIRQSDIVNATGHTLERISIFSNKTMDGNNHLIENSIENINQQIDNIVELIKRSIQISSDAKTLQVWDIDAEYNPQTYIDKGSISVGDNVAFKRIFDACNCFGHSYLGFQRGFTKHAIEDKMLWFPKLYENKDWENSIALNESEIYEKKKIGHDAYFVDAMNNPILFKDRIVFAHGKSNLGEVLYRFKGVYKLNKDKSLTQDRLVYDRVLTEDGMPVSVKTYRSIAS